MGESADRITSKADVQTPELPPDAWGAIARAALATEGDSVQTWARLSLVARAWRDGLRGVPVTVAFQTSMSTEQRAWLRSTAAPLRHITFCLRETRSHIVMEPDALLASLGTLLELHNVSMPPPDAHRRPHSPRQHLGLERFGNLRAVTVNEAHHIRDCRLPALPVSVRTLQLDAGRGTLRSLPERLQLAHLVRLSNVTLRGYSTHKRLWEDRQPQDGPPFPASLAALRLQSGYPLDLSELARGQERLAAAAANPSLLVKAPVVCCSLEWVTDDCMPQRVDNNSTVTTRRLASTLPAVFTALELDAQCVTINCSVAYQSADPAAAAWELGQFFAHAPPSYRRFSLRWDPNSLPLRVHLSWPLGAEEQNSTALARQGRVTFDGAKELAERLRGCAEMHGMAVKYAGPPLNQIVMARL